MATYRDAGVDLDAADRVVSSISSRVTATWGPEVVGGFGGFAAGLRLPPGYRRPVLMMSTDGVGTKADVARRAGMLDGLGFDLVAMCVDDLAAAGARPLALTDYLAVGRLDVAKVTSLVASIAEACAAAEVALLGGETAEHPGVMEPDAFDLAAAALGVVEEGQEITGSGIEAGDRILGIASPNLRSNGFSLVRATLLAEMALGDEFPGVGRTVAEVLLEPSVIYAPAIVDLVRRVGVHGLAHITGGGIPGNVPRILPERCDALIDTGAWPRPTVFDAIGRLGPVEPGEMFRTFNMGIGFVVVLPPSDAPVAIDVLNGHDHEVFEIGEVVAGTGAAVLR
jgi:phosphoribosylformylglycinamidine cyclo-ligase